MRIRRSILMDSTRGQYFHVVSRVVDKRFIFEDREKEVFRRMMRDYEGFTGVEVLSYCLMSNHFHMLVYVPRRPDSIPETEVLRRMGCLYKKDQMEEFREYLKGLESEETKRLREDFLDRFRVRMYHLSHFVRELKLRFSKYYNYRMERKGTLWEERFRCSLIEGHANALMNTAAYIELNPVRAGLVGDPKDYRWCSYTEALSGNRAARQGIISLASGENIAVPYKEAIKRYRDFFIYKSRTQTGSRKGMDPETGGELLEGGQPLSTADVTMVKVRFFVDGVVLGSREFVEDWYNRNREHLSKKRRRISNRVPLDQMDGIHTYRRVE